HARASERTSTPDADQPARPREDAIFSATVAPDESRRGHIEGPEVVPGVHAGSRRGPAHVAEYFSGGRGVGRLFGLPRIAPGRLPVPQQPAGAVLRREHE